MSSSADLVHFNGVDASSCEYLFPPQTPETVARLTVARLAADRMGRGDAIQELGRAQRSTRRTSKSRRTAMFGRPRRDRHRRIHFAGCVFDVEPRELAEAGWGVIFAAGTDPAIRSALEPLLAVRRQQAGDLYREYDQVGAYRPHESSIEFQLRHGVSPGPVVPTEMPYYLMIVGAPGEIPFSAQYQLDLQHAVGRLDLDSPDDYACYAANVVAAELGNPESELGDPKSKRDLGLFGVSHVGDPATESSCTNLVQPLAQRFTRRRGSASVDSVLGQQATKSRLTELVSGAAAPDVLFLAGHGIGFPAGDPRQRNDQGALLCADWQSTFSARSAEDLPSHAYFSAADIGDAVDLRTRVLFQFGCFTAGTPQHDSFAPRDDRESETSARRTAPLAPAPFVARLPQRLLTHPRGGLLAAIGHVDRAWSHSYSFKTRDRQVQTFEATLRAILAGHQVGLAMEHFGQRRAELATALLAALECARPDSWSVASLWTAYRDARNYVLLGDPATRLPPTPGSDHSRERTRR